MRLTLAAGYFFVLVSFAQAADPVLIEDFEFATSDEAAAAGVTDITDFANSPSYYIFGDDENASPNEPGGLFSIGTDSVFCQQACIACSFVGFKRQISGEFFPDSCGNQNFVPLLHTYGDPDHPGDVEPDFPIADLKVICDAYGNGSFADGLLATHFWVNLVDCEGEVFEYVNYAEPSLWSELWTFDVVMGDGFIRLSPDSLTEVPNGDRLLTEIAAIEVLIQDCDFPPTTIGKWYIDYLRIQEPDALLEGDFDENGVVDLEDFSILHDCLTGPGVAPSPACEPADLTGNGSVDLLDVAAFLALVGAA